MSPPLVSIVLPVFNGERFVEAALRSIWAQTFQGFEVLAINDGSTDGTADILSSVSDPRLRVLTNEPRRKLSGALNRGLEEARGVYIARMDADDVMRRHRLERQVEYLKQNPTIACCGSAVKRFGTGVGGVLRFPLSPAEVAAFSLFYSPFAHPSVMFRREWFQREGLIYDGSFYPAEDYELWTRVIQCFPCGNVPEVLLDYRVHDQSMTGGEWSAMDEQTVRIQQGLVVRMGLSPSPEQLRLHRAVSMGALPATLDSFDATEAWLLELKQANQQARQYSPDSFADILNYVWFRLAMSVVPVLRGAARSRFEKSELSGLGAQSARRRWVVRLASLKASLLGKPR